jgi:hypothetical protein
MRRVRTASITRRTVARTLRDVQRCAAHAAAVLASLLAFVVAAGAADPIRLELNAAEAVQNRCRLSFVVENPSDQNIDGLTLDLVLFNREGSIQQRLLAELAPVRRAKTMVKAFEVEGECARIGSILLNDVTVCLPPALGDCLDRLALAARVPTIKFFK